MEKNADKRETQGFTILTNPFFNKQVNTPHQVRQCLDTDL